MSRRLYYNGSIITMEEPVYAQAVLVEDGRIRAVGELDQVKAAADKDEPGEGKKAALEMADLAGRTLMPAFIDPHSHFTACANATMEADLGPAACFGDVVQIIRAFIEREKVPAGQWVKAGGYDHNRLAEKAHPDRHILDKATDSHPLVVQHQSGHMGVFNTMALEKLGVDAQTRAPQGGMIAAEQGIPTGYMEETAFVRYLKEAPMPGPEAFLKAYQKAQERYASYGITTVQEGMMNAQLGALYQLLLRSGILKLDLVAYMDVDDAGKLTAQFPGHVGQYRNHMKIGGYKMFLDGSPQGRTAWLRKPYLSEKPEEAATSYCGYATLTDEAVYQNLRMAEQQGLQILAHCNGDGACEQYLRTYAAVLRDLPEHTPGDIRPVMIHAQLLGLDQLDQVKALGVIPSFFLAHVYHWGDIHLKNLGPERAGHISPAHSALEKGIRFTLHQDAPVIQPDMMESVWCAVNRVTREGRTLGAEERIPVLEALKAVTINGAYQYFEEDIKGSIAPGKLADFVILESDPLKAAPMELKNIRVLATIKDGECIYRRDQRQAR